MCIIFLQFSFDFFQFSILNFLFSIKFRIFVSIICDKSIKMMKKTYQKPAMRVNTLLVENQLLSGSETVPGETDMKDYEWTDEVEE